MGIIEDVLEACIGGARAGPLKLVENGKIREVEHGQLNVMMLMPSGSGKSTFLDTIDDKMSIRVQDYSYPAMIGSIKKGGDFVPGYITKSAGKCMIIDEFHSLGQNSYRAMLSLLEQQRAHRVLGYNLNRPTKKKCKYFRLDAKGNSINITNLRFSCLCSGIFARKKKIDDMAFLSRFMPIALHPSLDEAYELLLGKHKRVVKPEYYSETPVFEDWEKFVRIHQSVVKSMKFTNKNMYEFLVENFNIPLRDCLHFARLFSYKCRGNGSVVDWEEFVPHIPFFLYNYRTSTLTLTEFNILEKFQSGMSTSKMAQLLSVSEPAISKILTKLRGSGLVKY